MNRVVWHDVPAHAVDPVCRDCSLIRSQERFMLTKHARNSRMILMVELFVRGRRLPEASSNLPRVAWCFLIAILIVAATSGNSHALPPQIVPGRELIVVPREPAADEEGHASELDKLLANEPLPPYHVHPNYYARDLQFQWDALPRGRVVVVVLHPQTKQRQCVEVVLPDGSPIIVHRRDSLTYLYKSQDGKSDERVIIQFGLFGKLGPHVHYRKGPGTFRAIQETAGRFRAKARELAGRIPVVGSVRDNARKVKDTAKGAAVIGGGAANTYSETVGKLLDGLPIISTVKSLGERAPELGRLEEARRAGDRASRNSGEFVRTVR